MSSNNVNSTEANKANNYNINNVDNKKMNNKNSHNVVSIILYTIIKRKWLSLGIIISVCGAVITALYPPLVLGKIVDTLTTGSQVPVYLVFVYMAFTVIAGLMEATREGLLTVFGQKITHALRSGLMEHFVRLSTDSLNKQEPGAVVSRFVGDVDTVENLFTSGIVSMFADACKIISILVVIWFRNKGLATVLIVLLPFLFWFTRHIQKNMLDAQLKNRRAVSRASGHVPETLHNIRTIHNLGKEKYMEKRYDEYISDSYKAMEKTNFYDAVYSPVILILNAVVVAVVMLFSASGNAKVLTLFGMSAGTAVAVINYISQIFSPVESLGMEIQTIQSAIAGVRRINEFFELPVLDNNEELQAEKTFDSKNDTPYVQFNDVTFGYEADHTVIADKTFVVNRGEQVTLSGRTGAGKSTIFKLLLGLYKPQKGSILINDMNSAAIPDNRKRKIFGYVEQSFHMVPGTIKDQITLYDKSISDEAVIKAAKLTGLHDTIMNFENGYDTQCTQELFSQGQWQLLSIARATAANPELLLLDEITANLDANTERDVLTALKGVSENRTVISISHRVTARTGRVINC
ncbi:ABC transporter ATP-binding protein [Lachnospira rogosae (ex Hitch et al. 2025)]|uniref:ABC transporter ATP-binding protein n=1 Tax=[Lactobacillus] rogosae TaxID=706562 RepID=UPI0032BF46BA